MAVWLTQRRHELGISRAELGRRLGLSAELLYRYENGELPIPGEHSAALVRELGRWTREQRPAAARALADGPPALWPPHEPEAGR